VAVRVRDGETVIQIKGEASFAHAPALESRLQNLSARCPRRVTLDLSSVTFISARGIGALTQFRRRVVHTGGRVRLASTLQPPVRELLEVVRLIELFETSVL
jgi:anti-anti-sigma factor